MRKIIIIPLLLLIFILLNIQGGHAEEKDFYFFSPEDIRNIKQSAGTEWGKQIIQSLKSSVEERLKHDMEVPTLEGGHGHDYCCPVHNVTFTFRWDTPTAHYCTACNKEYRNVNRYNWAWVNFVHANNYGFMNSCMYLYIATDQKIYACYIRDMLLGYAQKYPGYMVHNAARKQTEAFSGKMFAQSLDESVWASDVARAYAIAKDVMTPEEIKTIEKGYLRECANLLLRRKDGGNWQIWHNSGLAALGIALQDDSIIDVALNDPKCGYHYLFNKHVYPDGWWNEGSPTYHFYPLRAMLLTADAVRCRNINLFDNRLHAMFAAPVLGTYPDLSFPSHNDGWYGESLLAQAPLYEQAYTRMTDPVFLDVLKQCYRRTERNSCAALFNPISIDPAQRPIRLASHNFENAGYALLRSDAATVVMKYGPHGGGHGHPDKLSISIHNGKREILSDFGTSAYGAPDYTKWYRKTLSHNTITVDGKDQQNEAGSLSNFTGNKQGGRITAKAHNAYPGVKMQRMLELKGNRLHDIFTCYSDTVHQYDYVLVFNDRPSVSLPTSQGNAGQAEPYSRIKNVQQCASARSVTIHSGDSEIKIVSEKPFEVFYGEASGIPPTNPGVKTATGSEKRPVQPCYPVLIRIKDRQVKLHSTWIIN